MNLLTSGELEKSWDHPWTTDEMRRCHSDWSLAGDVGLLRHLQQFSENLTTAVKNTQTTLDLLNSQLNETTVLIDNVTNASLALANTQFIESRVYEDDNDREEQQDNTIKADENVLSSKDIVTETEMIAAISESIQRGLAIMDEKYERLDVLSSDSEDDNEMSQPSFILRPKDPYQNRPLPYVIGTDKWKASNKIGLQSSSSESEMFDGDDDDDDSDNDDNEDETENDKDMDELSQHIFIENSRRISILRRESSSSSESSDFNEKSITNKQYSGTSSRTDSKLYTRSQDTLNSTSEITTPSVALSRNSENITSDTPSFAEELAKRLGSVMPIKKSTIDKRNKNQSSINCHSNDDLFVNNENKNDNYNNDDDDDDDDGDDDGDDDDDDGNENIFSTKSDNLFSGGKGLFDDDDGEVSNSLWKDKLIKRSHTNIIPPSMDIPPPMHNTGIKQISDIDDLFGNDDSDNSDDIFTPRIPNKPSIIKSTNTSNISESNTLTLNIPSNKFSQISANEKINNDKITTSTPETNNNITNLFDDDENDGNLFGSPQKPTTSKLSPSSQDPPKGRPPGILVSQSDLLSSSLGSRLFQPTRQQSPDSSENESVEHQSNGSKRDNSIGPNENNSNVSTLGTSAMEAGNRVHVETSDSSGISVHPQSINSTLSLAGANNWTPQMESTRLASEDNYRDRVTSDSFLNSKTRHQNNNNSISTVNIGNTSSTNRIIESSNTNYDGNLFENDNDDVFSPPPLPKNKSKPESKVTSLFDDSDSGDDLFSNTSSGSRSHKSADILTNLTQQQSVEKSKSVQKQSGLFNDGIDIFANRDTSPDVDIFRSSLTSKSGENPLSKQSQLPIDRSKISLDNSDDILKKSRSIFDDSEAEDEDLFSPIIHNKSVVNKFDDENNFFSNLSVSSAGRDEVLTVPKKDFTAEVAVVVGGKESNVKSDEYKHDNDQTLTVNNISNSHYITTTENKLFDDSDDSDDDNLFSQKKSILSQLKSYKNQSIVTEEKLNEKMNSEIQSAQQEKKTMETVNESNELDITQSNDKQHRNEPITDEKIVSKTIKHTVNCPQEISTKREPPRSLKICLPTAGMGDDQNLPSRRAVSGKIKNLMDKMGDLKILSPTDTPLLLRKNDENPNSDDDNNTPDRDSEDGSSISVPSTKSLPILPQEKIVKRESPRSPPIEIETPVSFDIPAQADTLTITASKSRARIPAKRRPQSRHARQSALRTSGIDFDTVDTITDTSSNAVSSNEISHLDLNIERLATSIDGSDGDCDRSLIKPAKITLNFISDDRSELSLGKESSVSITKNTLLSPSTDEEDLFDVPPDLPEDPQKEDSLFGRAPILSPVQRRRHENSQNRFADELETSKNKIASLVNELTFENNLESSEISIENKIDCDNLGELTDPLHDGNHDPLKDPSQLFAFVTKTPSPEKGQNLLFNEDVSLFSQIKKQINDDTESTKKSFDIFVNDSSTDLFSGPFTKATTNKPIKGTKTNLFGDLDSDDDDETDDLFGSASSKRSNQSKSEHSDIDTIDVSNTSNNSPKQTNAFDDDDDDDLFYDANERPSPDTGKIDHLTSSSKAITANLEDIFGHPSHDNNDIFTIKKTIGRSTVSSGLFFTGDDDDDNNTSDIFTEKRTSNSDIVAESVEHRAPKKKSVTRDLRKTAEIIAEDPLSMPRDD